MRQETRLIKKILQLEYPDKKFKLKYRLAKNYIDSSDKIIISYSHDVNVNEIISVLMKYVIDIKVFEEGEVESIYERSRRINIPRIFSLDSHEWVETDLMEFIEVRKERWNAVFMWIER